MDVNTFLKERRKELGLTMKEVADKVGVSEGTISRWESGDIKNMKRDKVAALAIALDISPAIIMEWNIPDEQKATARFKPTEHEIEILTKYRAIDEQAQRRIDRMIDMEFEDSLQ